MKKLLEAAALLLAVALLAPLVVRAAAQAVPFLLMLLAIIAVYRILFSHTRKPW